MYTSSLLKLFQEQHSIMYITRCFAFEWTWNISLVGIWIKVLWHLPTVTQFRVIVQSSRLDNAPN